MRLLTLSLMVALLASFPVVEGHGVTEKSVQYEVIMYEGFPPESLPEKDSKTLPPEKALIIARVDADGKFQAKLDDMMFEGKLKSVRDRKVEIEIKQSHLYSTSGFPINAVVKLDQPVAPAGYAISSIVFSYYFRVRRKADDKPGPLETQQAAKSQEASITLPPSLARVLTDYERGWKAGDAAALAQLFTEDGFVLSPGQPPVKGRVAIQKLYTGAGSPLSLRAFGYAINGDVAYVVGGYSSASGVPDEGKFTLTLRKRNRRWLIASDMDNENRRR